MPLSRLGQQIAQAVSALHAAGVRFALIGGLALAWHKVVRATRDLDLLVEEEDATAADRELRKLGYEQVFRSDEVATYARGDERIDLLFARRPGARTLLAQAHAAGGELPQLRVVSAEGLIGFKLQGFLNDARRTQDLEDIRALLRSNRETLDMSQVRGYFRLFDSEGMLEEMLDELG
jgi:predicted nucleotidyltransferase